MSGVQFTTLVRVPFQRGDFVDPPQATWDAAKDRALWKIISKSSQASDLNWAELAQSFNVPPTFLLQQAAWLYERHFDHVRAQMKKVGGSAAPTAFSLDSTSPAVGGLPMKRGGSSGAQGQRAPSSLSMRQKDSSTPQGDVPPVGSGRPGPLSRTPSSNTITQARAYPQQAVSRNTAVRHRLSFASDRVDLPLSAPRTLEGSAGSIPEGSPIGPPSPSSSSSSSDSDEEHPATRSQLFKRPPRFRVQRPRELMSYDEDVEGEEHGADAAATLPFAQVPASRSDRKPQPPSTAKADVSPKDPGTESDGGISAPEPSPKVVNSISTASSASDIPKKGLKSPDLLSPKRRSDAAKSSPHRLALKGKREGSEGAPSMGSSFSDLDGS